MSELFVVAVVTVREGTEQDMRSTLRGHLRLLVTGMAEHETKFRCLPSCD